MNNYDEFFVKIRTGTSVHLHNLDSTVQVTRDLFEYVQFTDDRLVGSSYGYEMFAVETEGVIFLPILRRRAERDLRSSIVREINEQPFQQVILNLPRYVNNPMIEPYLTYEECLQSFPNIAWTLADVLILSRGEAGCCIRDYRSGFQFSGEAVSHSGGTPLDAIVRSVVSASRRLSSNNQDLGEEIIAACFNVYTGTLDLEKINRWCGLLKAEWDLIIRQGEKVTSKDL